jgi:hypothetical protein
MRVEIFNQIAQQPPFPILGIPPNIQASRGQRSREMKRDPRETLRIGKNRVISMRLLGRSQLKRMFRCQFGRQLGQDFMPIRQAHRNFLGIFPRRLRPHPHIGIGQAGKDIPKFLALLRSLARLPDAIAAMAQNSKNARSQDSNIRAPVVQIRDHSLGDDAIRRIAEIKSIWFHHLIAPP